MAFEILSKRYSKTDIPWRCSATMADQAVFKHVSEDTVPEIVQQPWQIERFSNGRCGRNENEQVQQPWQIKWFSNFGWMETANFGVQQPWQIGRFSNYFSLACHRMRFSNRDRSGGSQTLWGLHVGKKNVQQPWQIRRFSNRSIASSTLSHRSATMADQAVLKLAVQG